MSVARKKRIKIIRAGRPAVPPHQDRGQNTWHQIEPPDEEHYEMSADDKIKRRTLWGILDRGFSNAEIATKLGRPEKTVRRWSNRNSTPDSFLPVSVAEIGYAFQGLGITYFE
jgi:hypothetical protein